MSEGEIQRCLIAPGTTRETERRLYSDYTEISPWNPVYLKKYKRVQKPTWKYLMGTMSDFHQLVQPYPGLLAFFGFWRSLGMWMGVSNPFMGLCVFLAGCCDGWYNVIYMSWSVIWMMIWSAFLGVPKELIYNGLYPVQGMLLGYQMYITNTVDDQWDNIVQNLALLIPLYLFNIIFFQALCKIFVKLLNVSPMMIAGNFLSMALWLMKDKSTYFYTVNQIRPGYNVSDFKYDRGPVGKVPFSGNLTTLAYDVVYSFSSYQFSYSYWSALPLSVGILISSPILFCSCWGGCIFGVCFGVILSPVWNDYARRCYGLNCLITMSCITGTFFVLNIYSVILGILAVFFTIFLAMAIQTVLEPYGLPLIAVPCTITAITIYMTAGAFPKLIPVELASMTVPEDHLRRYFLSRKIIKELCIKKTGDGLHHLNPQTFRNIENAILPVLMCSYAKLGYTDKIKGLLDLGANPNSSDYDKRCAIHLAAAENQSEVLYLLLKYYADLNEPDTFGNNALSSALLAEHYNLALYIHKKGGRLMLSEERIASLLCNMANKNELKRMQVWLACGANPNIGDYDNRTPLHIAYAKKNYTIVELLKRHDSDINAADRWDRTPEEYVGMTIISNGAAINRQQSNFSSTSTKIKKTHRKFAHRTTQTLNVPSDLLSAVIHPISNGSDEEMRKALLPSLLCEVIFVRDRDLLNDSSMDPMMSDYDLRTPLHIAASIGDLEAVKVLVRNKANVNSLDRFGNTPLFEACMNKHDVVCEQLVQSGASLGLPSETQVSLLCWAVYNNDCDIITRLFENGIDLNCVDYDGRSCYDVAFDCQNHNVIELLDTLKAKGRGVDRSES